METIYNYSNPDMERWAEAAKHTYWELLGCQIEEISETKVVAYLDIESRHRNLIGILHGGVHASIMDSAMGLIAMIARPGADVVTVNLNMNYVAPTREGRIYVTAEIVHGSRKLVTTQAYARTESGDLLAFGTGTFRVLDHKSEVRPMEG